MYSFKSATVTIAKGGTDYTAIFEKLKSVKEGRIEFKSGRKVA